MKQFKDLKPGDVVYHMKLENFKIAQPNNFDTHRSIIIKSIKKLNETKYLDVIFRTGETIFPCEHLETHVMISHTESKTIHNIYATSRKKLFENAIEYVKGKVLNIRKDQEKLKNDELTLVNVMTSLLEEKAGYRNEENEYSLEEAASMAL